MAYKWAKWRARSQAKWVKLKCMLVTQIFLQLMLIIKILSGRQFQVGLAWHSPWRLDILQLMFQNTGYTDPGIYLHCPNLKTQLYGHVGEKKTENVRSWQACSRLCGQRTGCRYWTWHHTGQYHKANTCLTMTNVSSKGGNNNAVSGSKSCF